MGKLDGIGGVKAPGGFRDGKRKCPFAASWNISFQAGISSSRTVAWETRNMKEHPEQGGGYTGNHPWRPVATNHRLHWTRGKRMLAHPDELATLFSEASVAYASISRVGGWAVGDAREGPSISLPEDLDMSVDTEAGSMRSC
ncbi:hypothetical protein LEMLEM_LOCUS3746 [Lemmus lemmus]